jgi:Fe2+ transport system protein FeoA
VRVVALPAAAAADLVDEGLVSGTVVTVGARAPFGGPLLLEVGRARVAVSRSVASGILVEPAGIDR